AAPVGDDVATTEAAATRNAGRMSTAPCRTLSRAARGLSGLNTRSSVFFVEPFLRAPCSTASKLKAAVGRVIWASLRAMPSEMNESIEPPVPWWYTTSGQPVAGSVAVLGIVIAKQT